MNSDNIYRKYFSHCWVQFPPFEHINEYQVHSSIQVTIISKQNKCSEVYDHFTAQDSSCACICGYILRTLKEESFAGRNFRNFANFSVVRESLYPGNCSF